MAIKMLFRGIEFTAPNATEAAALARELTEQPAPKVGRPPKAVEHDEKNGADIIDTALGFLSIIAEAGPRGADGDEFMKLLNVTNPKGIGGRAVRINNLFRELGFRVEDVYANPKTVDGRFWRRGPKFDAVVAALKARKDQR